MSLIRIHHKVEINELHHLNTTFDNYEFFEIEK